jgi:hypothetical protein
LLHFRRPVSLIEALPKKPKSDISGSGRLAVRPDCSGGLMVQPAGRPDLRAEEQLNNIL